MRNVSVILAVMILSVSACKSSSESAKSDDKKETPEAAEKAKADPPKAEPPKAEPSEALKTALKVADEMCACTDVACAQKVVADNGEAMSKLQGYQPGSAEEGNALMAASQRMAECANKIQ